MKRPLAWLVISMLACPPAWSAETCRYSGTSSYSGRLSVETVASTANGETTVNVTARINARSFGILDLRYLHQEISVWRDGELRLAAINHRYSFAGSIRRQQWDVFTREPKGMAAYRAQAKTLGDFQSKHPGFVRHWESASFGQPWVGDYSAAAAERRPDLDLPAAAMPPGTGTPLAMAFHWVRWADPNGRNVPVFLPGFKKNARIDIPVTLADVDANGVRHIRSVVRHPQLSDAEPSVGDAWVSAGHRLLRVTFDAHGQYGSARGELRLDGCTGDAR